MEQSLKVVIGMSIAYFFSFLGLLLAYFSYRKKQRAKEQKGEKGE
jgi:predicted histidine transporter YuiF (NhaC family)